MEGTSKTAFTPSKTMDHEQSVYPQQVMAKKLNPSAPAKQKRLLSKMKLWHFRYLTWQIFNTWL